MAAAMAELLVNPCGSAPPVARRPAAPAAQTPSEDDPVVQVRAGDEVHNYGKFYNLATFINAGKVLNAGDFHNFMTIENTGTFANTGNLYNECGGQVTGAIDGKQPEQRCDLAIQVTPQEAGYSALGDVIHYDYTVTNHYPFKMFDILVYDVAAGSQVTVSCDDITAGVEPEASFHCTGAHTVTQADLDRGSVKDVAGAGVGPNRATYSQARATVPLMYGPAISFDPQYPNGERGWWVYPPGAAYVWVRASVESPRTVTGITCEDSIEGTITPDVLHAGTTDASAQIILEAQGVHTLSCRATASDGAFELGRCRGQARRGQPERYGRRNGQRPVLHPRDLDKIRRGRRLHLQRPHLGHLQLLAGRDADGDAGERQRRRVRRGRQL